MPAVLLLLISLGSLDSFVDDIGEGFPGMISSPAAGAGAAARQRQAAAGKTRGKIRGRQRRRRSTRRRCSPSCTRWWRGRA